MGYYLFKDAINSAIQSTLESGLGNVNDCLRSKVNEALIRALSWQLADIMPEEFYLKLRKEVRTVCIFILAPNLGLDLSLGELLAAKKSLAILKKGSRGLLPFLEKPRGAFGDRDSVYCSVSARIHDLETDLHFIEEGLDTSIQDMRRQLLPSDFIGPFTRRSILEPAGVFRAFEILKAWRPKFKQVKISFLGNKQNDSGKNLKRTPTANLLMMNFICALGFNMSDKNVEKLIADGREKWNSGEKLREMIISLSRENADQVATLSTMGRIV